VSPDRFLLCHVFIIWAHIKTSIPAVPLCGLLSDFDQVTAGLLLLCNYVAQLGSCGLTKSQLNPLRKKKKGQAEIRS
jgi:hypothetical protein